MANLTGPDRGRYVQTMFTRIAGRYDLMNRLMTAGQDRAWRREVIRLACLQPGQRLLDLGSGTGDLVFEALRQSPDVHPIAADFTFEMLHMGQQRLNGKKVPWSAAEALHLPFPEAAFDVVVSGFLLRNVADVGSVLREEYRVLKPGGRLVNLDTTPPQPGLLSPLIHFHLHFIIPTLGRWITHQAEAYTYLPDSTEGFLSAQALSERMTQAGFQAVRFQKRMFGTVAIHSARK